MSAGRVATGLDLPLEEVLERVQGLQVASGFRPFEGRVSLTKAFGLAVGRRLGAGFRVAGGMLALEIRRRTTFLGAGVPLLLQALGATQVLITESTLRIRPPLPLSRLCAVVQLILLLFDRRVFFLRYGPRNADEKTADGGETEEERGRMERLPVGAEKEPGRLEWSGA